MKKKGTEIILDTLVEEGVDTLFGYPGGTVIPLFDELMNYDELEMILVRHEQAATHAADGLARYTGKTQVVIATSGPGATNCITGLATALIDSVPMVCITGQVRREVIGTDAFQETNVLGVSRPVTKHNYLVKDIHSLQRIIKEAFFIANSGRPGPVLIDIPVDVQREEADIEPFNEKIVLRGYHQSYSVEGGDVKKAWELIKTAQRPMVYAGGGINISASAAELKLFAETTNIPVATTLLGQGSIAENHPLSLGMLGMHGTCAANLAISRCDLVIALGARFDDRVTGNVDEFLKNSKIIHVDIDPSSIDKIKIADLGILSDVKVFLKELNHLAETLNLEEWLDELEMLKKDHPLPNYDHLESEKDKLRPEYVIKTISELTDGDAVVVTDVGQHQMFTALHYSFKNKRSHITSGGLGTMGFALPAAMGIALKERTIPVLSISGDGGFQMNMQELATIRENNIPVKIIILNNTNLGMVKQWQDIFWESRYASTIFDKNPSFVKLAEVYDIPAFYIGEKHDLKNQLQTAFATEGPVLIEIKIDKDAHVYPMIPSGGTIEDMIYG